MEPQFSLDLFSTTTEPEAPVVQFTTTEVSVVPQVCIEPEEPVKERKISEEEIGFEWMIKELMTHKAIKSYSMQPKAYRLTESKQFTAMIKLKSMKVAKAMPRELIAKHLYTSDFKIVWEKAAHHYLHECPFEVVLNKEVPFFSNLDPETGDYYSIIEVKANFDQNNMTRLFSMNQKWVLEVHNIYVELVKVPDIYKRMFVPLKAMFTPKKHDVKKWSFKVLACSEYLKGIGYGQ